MSLKCLLHKYMQHESPTWLSIAFLLNVLFSQKPEFMEGYLKYI